jgi:TRAP-type mannitol/chloroaromatic compound transport system permease large subunit
VGDAGVREPDMLIVIICMVFMYIWPGMTLWLPNYLYGG